MYYLDISYNDHSLQNNPKAFKQHSNLKKTKHNWKLINLHYLVL